MPKKPGRLQLRQQRTRHPPWFDCTHLSVISLHHPAPPHPLPRSSSPPSGWNVSMHFSLYALCLTDVGERSLWWCCAGELSRNVRELLMSCNSWKAPLWVWHIRIFPLVKSARMYAQVCFGNYLFKLFKKCMSKHPYQYFILRIHLFQMNILNLNFKLILQSLLFLCRQVGTCEEPVWLVTPWPSVLTCTTVCQDYTFSSSAVIGQFRCELCLMPQTNSIYRGTNLSSKTYFIPVHPFSQWHQWIFDVVHWIPTTDLSVCVNHTMKKKEKISQSDRLSKCRLAFTSCAMTINQKVCQC